HRLFPRTLDAGEHLAYHVRRVARVAEDIHDVDVDVVRDVPDARVARHVQAGRLLGIDGNYLVAGSPQVTRDAVAGTGRIVGAPDDGDHLCGFEDILEVGHGIIS